MPDMMDRMMHQWDATVAAPFRRAEPEVDPDPPSARGRN
jgi:hypothetical protein